MLSREVLKNIRRIHLHARFLVRDAMMGEYKSSFKGQGMEFEEVREYFPGDDVRHIDWNVTARTQVPHVKKFCEERELTVYLLVDMSASGNFGTRGRFKREMIAEIAAALAYLAVQNNDKVGVILFTNRIEKFIAPQKGRNHVLRVIREILAFEPVARGTHIGEALRFLMKVSRRRSVVFLLSDFQCANYESALKLACLKHDVVAITPVDPVEQKLPDVGLLALQDAETGEVKVVDTASKAVREQFEFFTRESEAVLQSRLQRNRIERIVVKTGESYLKPLVAFFEKRTRLKTKGIGVLALVALLFATSSGTGAHAQNLDPLKGTTAEVYHYSYEFTHAPGETVLPPDVEGLVSTQDLRVVGKREEHPIVRDGKVVRKFIFDFAADLPGAYEIPKLVFKIGNNELVASAISFDVLSVTAAPKNGEKDKPDILDIRDIREEKWPYRYTIAVAIGVVFLLVAIGYAMFKLSGRSLFFRKARSESILSCHEKALASLNNLLVPELDSLENEARIQVVSQFHYRLGLVFREYCEERFFAHATDMTSDEFWHTLQSAVAVQETLGQDTIKACRTFLLSADLVKFAKVGSSEQDLKEAKAFVKNIVERVRNLDDAAKRALEKEPWRNEKGVKL